MTTIPTPHEQFLYAFQNDQNEHVLNKWKQQIQQNNLQCVYMIIQESIDDMNSNNFSSQGNEFHTLRLFFKEYDQVHIYSVSVQFEHQQHQQPYTQTISN